MLIDSETLLNTLENDQWTLHDQYILVILFTRHFIMQKIEPHYFYVGFGFLLLYDDAIMDDFGNAVLTNATGEMWSNDNTWDMLW